MHDLQLGTCFQVKIWRFIALPTAQLSLELLVTLRAGR